MHLKIGGDTGIASSHCSINWVCLSGSGTGPRKSLEPSLSRRKPAFFLVHRGIMWSLLVDPKRTYDAFWYHGWYRVDLGHSLG